MNKDVLIVPDRISSTQCGIKILKKPTGVREIICFQTQKPQFVTFVQKKYRLNRFIRVPKRLLTDLKCEDVLTVRAKANRYTDKYEANKQEVEEIKIKSTNYNYFDFL